MIHIDASLQAGDLEPVIDRLFTVSGPKLAALEARWTPERGAPVLTVGGRYTTRGWTEWTQGFRIGSLLLQFEVSGDRSCLETGQRLTLEHMPAQLTHHGVHDHGFHAISTWGNLLRLMAEGRIPADPWERRCHELALRTSGAVQAARWTALPDGLGYVYSFNGPHSLFADTMRTLRVLALADRLGQVLLGERDARIDLLGRLLTHAETTARFNVYFGDGRDAFDVRGRVAHESIFDVVDGSYRCPSTQQGWSPFTTWTRGQAWVLCGYAEQLEFLEEVPETRVARHGGKAAVLARFREVAEAVAEHYLAQTPPDGIPYWDTGAPGLARIPDWRERPADPENPFEPVDSSAATIAAQGLLRLGRWLLAHGDASGQRYWQAGLSVAKTALAEPYLAVDPDHEGLIRHAVYHRPRGWDHVPDGASVPCRESTMWGDYHARELALLLRREARGEPWLTFFTV